MADSSDQQQKINTLLEEGNRSLSLNDYETSVEKLGEACQLLDSIHGELAPESGDAYFAYGRALLQHAIQQNTVLGDSKRQDEAAAASTASSEAKPKTTSNSKFHFEDDEQEEEEDQEQDEQQQQQGDDEDDEDDFQTAWEILDLSRVILEKSDDKETRLKLADVHLCLGDVSVETEKFDQALPDYRKALEIKKELLDQGDRQLAEAHYKLALALEFSTNEGDQAGEEIKNAIQVLKKRIESIQADTSKDEEDVKGKGKAATTPAAADDNKEVKEIKQLIVDMEEKAEELTSRQEKQKEAEALLKSFLGAGGQSAVAALNTATVNDLSSMIKRKSTNNPDGNSNKKQKQ
ncbi:hypothetical protein O0I10_001260 [Lichtheimia ornata]|uniref:Tetratricopeptide SHNi-TPR domain-containing protein n=1 Tax=Lichtheimia ornata TaxID=688661 RepID=A0AAD7Y3F3_9FUNG|nr:uncharacterized protein O0I10_001260 [Lichtheimia ornata]KAJ8663083.1 hypothetical protein O0I10_001260 [Lichtheimia ornata]